MPPFTQDSVEEVIVEENVQNNIHERDKWEKIMFFVLSLFGLVLLCIGFAYVCKNHNKIWNKLRHCVQYFLSKETYDIYACFPAKDSIWVRDIIKEKLADEYGFSLCVHYVHTPKDIVLTDMEKSRCVLFILTENFDKTDEISDGLEVYKKLQEADIKKGLVTLQFSSNGNKNVSLAKESRDILLKGPFIHWPYACDVIGKIHELATKVYDVLPPTFATGSHISCVGSDVTGVHSKTTECTSLASKTSGYDSVDKCKHAVLATTDDKI